MITHQRAGKVQSHVSPQLLDHSVLILRALVMPAGGLLAASMCHGRTGIEYLLLTGHSSGEELPLDAQIGLPQAFPSHLGVASSRLKLPR